MSSHDQPHCSNNPGYADRFLGLGQTICSLHAVSCHLLLFVYSFKLFIQNYMITVTYYGRSPYQEIATPPHSLVLAIFFSGVSSTVVQVCNVLPCSSAAVPIKSVILREPDSTPVWELVYRHYLRGFDDTIPHRFLGSYGHPVVILLDIE